MALLKSSGCGQAVRRMPWLAAMALLSLIWPAAGAELASAREYQVKAVFLFNFAQFVEWPPGTFADDRAPLVIGVLGEDPFDGVLDDAVRGEVVNGRPLAVRRYRRVTDATDCHILFISRSETAGLSAILATLKDRRVLTVGDADTFARQGGMIRFVTEAGRVRLRINLDAAKAAGLTLSSKLLRPAQIVATGKD